MGVSNPTEQAPTWILQLAKLLRLVRVMRMARLMRAAPELMIMIKGILASVKSVLTTLFLLLCVHYAFGLAFCYVSKNTALAASSSLFPNVAASMYNLMFYGVLSLDFAQDVASKIYHNLGAQYAFFYYLFILVAAFTVMNMMVGVLFEVVLAVTETEKERMALDSAREKLFSLMESLDGDCDYTITRT